ncbi:L10-interacting MYB domain-containing protein-like [Senna tora]|uniref:L10-interacting MYB domain-containing protein-like n=1 Tax=Senna tora TaxID=362788 RepID=A0A834TG95_9FABA|nr:L10-interacting MYB domain-containing protein-like [Senna tora]
MGDGEGDATEKAKWEDKNTKEFLKVCVEEIAAGNRPHAHFTREGWRNVIKKFNEKTGHAYVQKQLKNRWDSLKSYFFLWAKLIGKEIGLGWDPNKKSIKASNDWWATKGKENSEYLKFKHQGPKHLDLLERCYKDVIAIGYCTLEPHEDPSLDEGGNNNDGNANGGDIG